LDKKAGSFVFLAHCHILQTLTYPTVLKDNRKVHEGTVLSSKNLDLFMETLFEITNLAFSVHHWLKNVENGV